MDSDKQTSNEPLDGNTQSDQNQYYDQQPNDQQLNDQQPNDQQLNDQQPNDQQLNENQVYGNQPYGNQPYGNQSRQQEAPPVVKKQNNMETASLVMGILGLVTTCCCYGGLIFGSLGLLFALLSKTEDHFNGFAKAGFITSIIALVITPILGILLFSSFIFSDALFQLNAIGVPYIQGMGGAF